MGIGDWGLGLGFGGLALGLWPQTPKPQSPIPNPQSPIPILNLIIILRKHFNLKSKNNKKEINLK